MIITDKLLAARRRQLMATRWAMTIAASVIVLAASPALAGTTSPRPVPVNRDHRGDKDTTTYIRSGLKPPGARRDPGWGSYGNGKGSGPTVRDHRH